MFFYGFFYDLGNVPPHRIPDTCRKVGGSPPPYNLAGVWPASGQHRNYGGGSPPYNFLLCPDLYGGTPPIEHPHQKGPSPLKLFGVWNLFRALGLFLWVTRMNQLRPPGGQNDVFLTFLIFVVLLGIVIFF